MSKEASITMLETAALALGDLTDEVVFVGGSIAPFYIDDPAAQEARPTEDVDVVVEAVSRSKIESIHKRVREKGFRDNIKSGVIGSFRRGELVLDVMASEPNGFGPFNLWYPEGIQNAQTVTLPYLLGSKIEAFKGRGDGDFLMSHDMEDTLLVMDGSQKLEESIEEAPAGIRSYLRKEFSRYLKNSDFLEALEGQIPKRCEILKKRLHHLF